LQTRTELPGRIREIRALRTATPIPYFQGDFGWKYRASREEFTALPGSFYRTTGEIFEPDTEPPGRFSDVSLYLD
jgi:hypothetical protein